MDHSRPLFSIFVFSLQLTVNKCSIEQFAYYWIQIMVLGRQRQPLFRMRYNQWPLPLLGATGQDRPIKMISNCQQKRGIFFLKSKFNTFAKSKKKETEEDVSKIEAEYNFVNPIWPWLFIGSCCLFVGFVRAKCLYVREWCRYLTLSFVKRGERQRDRESTFEQVLEIVFELSLNVLNRCVCTYVRKREKDKSVNYVENWR